MAEHEKSYETAEGVGTSASGARTVDEARSLHHLATADPERDGKLTGPAHEAKYGLDRADGSAAAWRAQGVHPTENRALVGDEDGAENLRGMAAAEPAAVGEQSAPSPAAEQVTPGA